MRWCRLWCVWCVKDTNSKANHNYITYIVYLYTVCLMCQRYKFKSKSQREVLEKLDELRCVWCVKDTNSKANHNAPLPTLQFRGGVFDVSKIQIQKQITTYAKWPFRNSKVCLMCQRYKFKSKSQRQVLNTVRPIGVFDVSKIQIQKQITTSVFIIFI